MPDIFGLILVLVFLWFLMPFVLWASFKSRVNRLAESMESLGKQLAAAIKRLDKLEKQARHAGAARAAEGPSAAGGVLSAEAQKAAAPPGGSRVTAEKPAVAVPPAAAEKAAPTPGAPQAPGEKPAAKPAYVAPKTMKPAPSVASRAAAAPPAPPAPPAPKQPLFAQLLSSLGESIPRRGMSLAEWETLVGGNLLNKLGIVVFVIGVALLLGYSLRYFGPLGRIATGAATGFGLLVAGIVLERREQYAIFARPIIGGGWAILYFTAFATYNVEASKIVDEPGTALVIMAIVAAGIIAHSFRYRSQVVTSLAYGLAYLAIVISPLTSFSLVAIALLAASLLAVVRVMPWYHLALVATAGTYLSHFIWMGQASAEPGQAGFWLNQGLLAFYWLVFVAVAFLRHKTQPIPAPPETMREALAEERTLLALGVGNTVGFLGLSAWSVQTVFPDSLYVLTGGATVAYAAVAYLLHVRGRVSLALFNASVAVVLAAVTLPLALRAWPALEREWLALYWAAEAGLVVVLGLRMRQLLLRIESYLLCLASLLALLAINLGAPTAGRHLLVWLTVVPVIAFLFYMFEKLKKVAGHADVLAEGRNLGIAFGYAATLIFALLIWREASYELFGPIWLLVGLAFLEFGLATQRQHVRGQGYLLTALAAAALFLTNLYELYLPAGLQFALPRWVVILPSAAIFYYLSWRLHGARRGERVSPAEGRFADLPSYVATGLLAVLLWRELPSVAVALSWGVLGLVLFEVGCLTAQPALRWQAHVVLGATFVRLFMANFTSTTETFGISHRLITVTPLVAITYYLFWRLRDLGKLSQRFVFERHLDVVYSYAAAVLLVVLARFEFGRAYTVIAWAPLMLVFLILGVLREERDFRFQSYILAVLAFERSWATNVYLTGSLYGIAERYATTVPMIAAFLVAALFCIRRRDSYVDLAFHEQAGRRSQKILGGLDVHSRALFAVLGPALIAILLFHEVSGNVLTMAWSFEAFLVLALGFVVVERSFRLFGLALLAVCLVKLLAIDLREVETLYRIVSYIVLGILLLLASFAYTRYRDTIKRYL